MKRPLSVWIVQILLSIPCLIALPVLFSWPGMTLRNFWGSSRSPTDFLLFLLAFAVEFGVVAFFVTSIFAIAKRWKKSRVMGIVALLMLFSIVVYSKLTALPSGQGFPKYTLNSAAERGGADVANIVMFIGFWILFYRFGFSKKARSFFSQPPARSSNKFDAVQSTVE